MRGADNHHVFGDNGRAVPRHLALDRIDDLVVVFLQIDNTVGAEVLERHAVPGVEADELVTDRDVEDSLVALAVGPVADAATGKTPRRTQRALALVEAMHPQQLAGLRVERDGVAMLADGRVEHAVDHQRRGLEVEVGPRAHAVRAEAPGNLQLAEVRRGDLIERRVARDAEIATPVPPSPLAACWAEAAVRREGGMAIRLGTTFLFSVLPYLILTSHFASGSGRAARDRPCSSFLAGLHVERRARADRRPHAAALPAALRSSMRPSIHFCRTRSVGNAQHDPLAVLQRQQASDALPVLIGTFSPRPSAPN